MPKPRLLYVSPVQPARTGNGLAMRAGNVLEALGHHYRVGLHVAPVYASHERFAPEPPRRRFDVLHVFRLAALPYARAVRAETRHVDLDDIESATHRRLAALARSRGDEERAARMEREARRYEPLEKEVLGSWDRVYIASETDRGELAGRIEAEVRVLPNVVAFPPAAAPKEAHRPFTFLFVANLDYYPNEDAVRWFCDAVLPELRAIAPAPFRVVVVGGELPDVAGVEFAGVVPAVGPWYGGADAAIVPLRAGGGTRIKILEAFAHRVPVVSTPLGAEGLEVRHEQHLLLAESAAAFAGQCVELMADPALAQRLTDQADRLARASHSLDAAVAAVAPAGARPRSAAPADDEPPRPS